MSHTLTDENVNVLPVLDVTVGYAVLCVLDLWGLFDEYDVEAGFETFGEFPSVYARRLPSYIKMPFNTLVNILYLLCGCYWLRRTNMEEEKEAETRRLRGPLLMPLADAYYFRVYGWMCMYYSITQLLSVIRPHRRVLCMLKLCRLILLSWLVVWSIHILEWVRYSTALCIGGPLISLLNFTILVSDPHGYERAQAAHFAAVVVLVGYMQAVYGDTGHSFVCLALMVLFGLAFWILLRSDMDLATEGPYIFRIITGYFWSRVCEVAVMHLVAHFMLTILVNKYIDKSLQFNYDVPQRYALYRRV